MPTTNDAAYFEDPRDARLARLQTFKQCRWTFSQVEIVSYCNLWSPTTLYQVVGYSDDSRRPLTLCNDGHYR